MMKNIIVIGCLLGMLPSLLFAGVESDMAPKDKLGYALGMDIGNSVKRMNPPINLDMLLKGLQDAYVGNDFLITVEEAYKAKKEYSASNHGNDDRAQEAKLLREKRAMMKKDMPKWRRETAFKNRAKAREFSKANRNMLGTIEASSGLQYSVITEGHGQQPLLTDIVKINYEGTSLAGKVFDSSYKRGRANMFRVNKTIDGWQEALQTMKVGGKYRFFIPSDLAFGDNGAGTFVEPGEALVFEIELLAIVDDASFNSSPDRYRKVPPYTAPGQEKIVLKPQSNNPKIESILEKEELSIATLEDAGQAFILLRGSLMPFTEDGYIVKLCQELAVEEFQSQCVEHMQARLKWVKGLKGLAADEFPTGKISKSQKFDNAVNITWKEVISFKNAKQQVKNGYIRLFLTNIAGDWKINKIDTIASTEQ